MNNESDLEAFGYDWVESASDPAWEKEFMSQKTNFELVSDFTKSMGQPVKENFKDSSDSLIKFRLDLIDEEVSELYDALWEDGYFLGSEANLENVLKELVDILYVVYGFGVTFGLPMDEAFLEVHESNMSKLGPDGKPAYREDGKVLKGDSYREADMGKVIK